MNTWLFEWSQWAPRAGRKTYLHTSPYAGPVDFSALRTRRVHRSMIDHVSLADLLRNAFVYPPHSIYRDVKNVATGFTSPLDMEDELRFHFAYQTTAATARPRPGAVSDEALIGTYHRLLTEAVRHATAGMRSPWHLQSGGKDSTSLAIAIAEVRPDTHCITYLGGREENEVESARFVARRLGLRHEGLVCDPARAYDRYLAMVARMPLLTADFATLAYADLATQIAQAQGDGIIDGLGVDPYFGTPLHLKDHLLGLLARKLRIPGSLFRHPLVRRSFRLCFALGTLQMNAFERHFPGSRFSDEEVDELLGWRVSSYSRKRMEAFQEDLQAAESAEAVRRLLLVVLEAAGFAKGMYPAQSLELPLAYPYCDRQLCEWVFNDVPDDRLIGPGGENKVLMRKHIAQHFDRLPYVASKGSFRFDVQGLAQRRYEQVHAFAQEARELLPGATRWLEQHRHCLGNKYFASKFYLLAVTLPWLISHLDRPASGETPP
jgi:asparagine synthetase B (glutamine-hydrolysing)